MGCFEQLFLRNFCVFRVLTEYLSLADCLCLVTLTFLHQPNEFIGMCRAYFAIYDAQLRVVISGDLFDNVHIEEVVLSHVL